MNECKESEKLDTKYTALARCASAVISPMCAFLGGIVGQEVLKACNHKFTPLRQLSVCPFWTIIIANTKHRTADTTTIFLSDIRRMNVAITRGNGCVTHIRFNKCSQKYELKIK